MWLCLVQDDKNLNYSAKGCRVLWNDPVGSASQGTYLEGGAGYVYSGPCFWLTFVNLSFLVDAMTNGQTLLEGDPGQV